MWLFLSSPSLCIILHPQPLLSSSQRLRNKSMSKVLQCITVPWYEERLVCVTNRIWQKWWLPFLRLGYKRVWLLPWWRVFSLPPSLLHLCLFLSSLTEKASCHVKYGKPEWWGTEASGQNSVRNWSLRTTTWMALEVDLPSPVKPYDDFPG